MTVWAEAHDLPHLADPGKKVAFIPILDYRTGKHADAFREEGAIKIPVGYARLDDVHFVDPDDHSNDVGSVVFIYQRDVVGSDGRPNPVGAFVSERRPDDLQSRATSVTDISGRGLTPYFLDRMRLLPFDYPSQPTVQSEWNFGVPEDGGLLVNGDFEGEPLLNGGFEEGTIAGWQATDASEIFANASISAINSAVDARSGDWYGLVNPSGAMGGAKRSIPGFVPGETYTIVGWLNDPSATGDRFRAGVSGAISASHTNWYEEDGFFWADIGNAAQGAGASTGVYQSFTLTFIAADTSIELVVLYDDINDPNFQLDDWSVVGQGVGVTGWTPYKWSGGIGTLNDYEYDTSQANTGNSSLHISGSVNLWTDGFGRSSYPGIGTWQQATLVPGKYYTATVWVRHNGTGNEPFSLILDRVTPKGDLAETLTGAFAPGPGSYHMAARNVQVPANTWTRIQMTVIADTVQVRFMIRWRGSLGTTNIGTINSPDVWFDTASLFEGLPAVNMGEVWEMIQGDRLQWLVPTWTTTLDSDGDAWDTERSFSMSEGDTWGQIAEAFQRLWGYVHRIRYDREDNTYYFDIFNPGYLEVDHSTTDSGSLIVGMNILGGETITRTPDATTQRVTGEGGVWVEETDAILEAAWGEADGFLKADKIGVTADLQAILDKAQEQTLDQMVTFEAEMTNQGQVIPFRDIDVFHNVSVELGARSSIPRGDRVITSVVMSGKPGARPSYQVYVNSDAFASTGAAALAEAVRRLLRRRTPENPALQATNIEGGEGGGAPTIFIAAADATDWSKSKADMQCLGFNDHLVIQAALDELTETGGRLVLSEGTFNVDTDQIVLPTDVWLMGLGRFTGTFITASGTGTVIGVTDDCTVSDLSISCFDGCGSSGTGIAGPGADNVTIRNVRFQLITTAISHGGDHWQVHDASANVVSNFLLSTAAHDYLQITGCFTAGRINLNGASHVAITGNILRSLIDVGAGGAVNISGNTYDNPGGAGSALVTANGATGLTYEGNTAIESDGYTGLDLTNCPDALVASNVFGDVLVGVDLDTCNRAKITDNIFGGDPPGAFVPYLGQSGIIVHSSNNVTVHGNTINQPGQDTDNTHDGIRVTGTSSDCSVQGNKVIPSQEIEQTRYGVAVGVGTSCTVVVGNVLGLAADYGTDALLDSGTDTILTYPNHVTYGDNFTCEEGS